MEWKLPAAHLGGLAAQGAPTVSRLLPAVETWFGGASFGGGGEGRILNLGSAQGSGRSNQALLHGKGQQD